MAEDSAADDGGGMAAIKGSDSATNMVASELASFGDAVKTISVRFKMRAVYQDHAPTKAAMVFLSGVFSRVEDTVANELRKVKP